MPTPASPVDESPIDARALNEDARLYPWRVFNQQELQVMTGYPREVIRAAFSAPDFPSQFGRSRPEEVIRWVMQRDRKATLKDLS